MDILLSDPTKHPPLFSEGSLQIVAPTSVVAHLSVKTQFTKATLVEAAKNIARTQRVICRYAESANVWRGICFFDVSDSRDATSILDTVGDALSEGVCAVYAETQSPAARRAIPALMPTSIVVLDRIAIFVKPAGPMSVTLHLFELGSTSVAAVFTDLFGSIQRWFGRSTPSEIEEMVRLLRSPPPLTKEIELQGMLPR
ncbi:MAG: hypothetical protein AB7O31_11845 [Burkholderiales bacterium]